jgi:hypothetical protein
VRLGKAVDANPTVDLSELKVVVEHAEDGGFGLTAHLTFGTAFLELNDQEYGISAKIAHLELHCEGVEVVPGSKHGVLDRSGVSSTEVTSERIKSLEAQGRTKTTMAGGLSTTGAPTGSANTEAGVEASAKASSQTTTKTSTTKDRLPVQALGGNTWRIRNVVDEEPLDGRYLGGAKLCDLKEDGRPNRLHVDALVLVKQRDLTISPTPDKSWIPRRGNLNREKLLGVLIARSIHECLESSSYKGTIILSSSTSESGSDED